VTPSLDAPPPTVDAAKLSGYVYHDVNENGGHDQEDSGLSGVGLTLYDANLVVVAQTTTQDDGSYAFTGLAAGEYILVESQPDGYGQGTNELGSNGGALYTDMVDAFTVTLAAGDNATGYLFGDVLAAPNS
jgi:hypothetical protein